MFPKYGPPPPDRDNAPMTQEDWLGAVFLTVLGLSGIAFMALLMLSK